MSFCEEEEFEHEETLDFINDSQDFGFELGQNAPASYRKIRPPKIKPNDNYSMLINKLTKILGFWQNYFSHIAFSFEAKTIKKVSNSSEIPLLSKYQ
jgi:hypothetical protein